MTPAGWIIMILSVGSVLALATYCFYRVLSLPPSEVDQLVSPLDIDTRDTQDAD